MQNSTVIKAGAVAVYSVGIYFGAVFFHFKFINFGKCKFLGKTGQALLFIVFQKKYKSVLVGFEVAEVFVLAINAFAGCPWFAAVCAKVDNAPKAVGQFFDFHKLHHTPKFLL